MTTTVRTGVVLVTALLLQVAVVPWLTIAGVQVDLLLLVTLAAGLSGGPERGARVGFVAGILWDLVVVGPFGLSALTYCLAGYFVGSAQRSVVGPTWWAPIPGAALAGAASVFFYATVGAVFGYEEWLDGQTLVDRRRGRAVGRGLSAARDPYPGLDRGGAARTAVPLTTAPPGQLRSRAGPAPLSDHRIPSMTASHTSP